MKMKSKVSLGRSVLLTTVAVNILIVVALFFTAGSVVDGDRQVVMAIVSAVLLATVLVTPLFKPASLLLTGDELRICFPLHAVGIPLAQIEAVEPRAKYKDYADLRTFGSGGFWGFLGRFHNNGVGYYTSYVGNRKEAFYVRLRSGKVYLLSCDDSAEMMRRLRGGLA